MADLNDLQPYKIEYTAKEVEGLLLKIKNIEHELKDSDNPISSKAVLDSFDNLKTIVNTGKELIAKAITEKGVNTEIKNTFEEMANNISSIQTSSSINGKLMASLVKEVNTVIKKSITILTEAEISEKPKMQNFVLSSRIEDKKPITILTEAEVLEKKPMRSFAVPAYIEGYE